MDRKTPSGHEDAIWNRHDFLRFAGGGLASTALWTLLHRDQPLQASNLDPPATSSPAAKAKQVIHICLVGGYSQIDSFDYKQELEKRDGQALGGFPIQPQAALRRLVVLLLMDAVTQRLQPYLAREALTAEHLVQREVQGGGRDGV